MGRPRWSAKWPFVIATLAAGVLVGGVGTWAVGTESAGPVIATGTLQVENNSQVVQHPDGGVVQEILARNGDRVLAGDTLFRLDDVFLRTELAVIEGQISEIFVRKARLRAERDGAPDVTYGSAPVFEAVTQGMVSDLTSGQLALFHARIDSTERRKDQILRQQRQIENRIASEAEAVQTLVDRGLAQLPRLLGLQRSAAELQGRAGSLHGRIAEARTRISTLELDALHLDDQRREEAITQLRDLELNERELTERRIALLERLGRLNIVAPVGGVVFGSRVFAERAVIRAADPLLYLVPEDQPLHVSARIDPIHVDQLYAGQDVALVFSAFDRRTTPEGTGHIALVSADAAIDEVTGVPYYEAMVLIDDTFLEKLDGLDLLPGMPVETFIKTDMRTPMSYLVQPLLVYFQRAFREE